MNVTPLVDVVLVLLIIFMVVIPKLAEGVHVDLPRIFSGEDNERSRLDPIRVSVTADGSLYLERAPIELANLEQELARLHRADARKRVVLRSDQAVRYARVREVFALCQRLDFPSVSLQVSDDSSASEQRSKP